MTAPLIAGNHSALSNHTQGVFWPAQTPHAYLAYVERNLNALGADASARDLAFWQQRRLVAKAQVAGMGR